MAYKVIVTKVAEADLDNFLRYLINVKENPQAAQNVLDDFEMTIERLALIAGSLKFCDNPKLKMFWYL